MTREEHLTWCKERAIEYVDAGDLTNAVMSMCSDVGKHEETKDHPGVMLGVVELMNLPTADSVRRFIEGFN